MDGPRHAREAAVAIDVPDYVREVVEEVAFQARAGPKVDKRSGVSQRLPISRPRERRLERRAPRARRTARRWSSRASPTSTRRSPRSPASSSWSTKGELRGADTVARDLIRAAVGNVFTGYFDGADLRQVIEWFDLGGSLQVDDTLNAAELLDAAAQVQGLRDVAALAGVAAETPAPLAAAAVDFVLEGLYAQKKIARIDEWQYQASEQPRRPARTARRPDASASCRCPADEEEVLQLTQ